MRSALRTRPGSETTPPLSVPPTLLPLVLADRRRRLVRLSPELTRAERTADPRALAVTDRPVTMNALELPARAGRGLMRCWPPRRLAAGAAAHEIGVAALAVGLQDDQPCGL